MPASTTVRAPLVALLLLAGAQTGSAAQNDVRGPELPGRPRTPAPQLPTAPGATGPSPTENGGRCVADANCRSVNCRPFPDQASYCAEVGKLCPLPGRDGARAGQRITLEQKCYECRLGRGWLPC